MATLRVKTRTGAFGQRARGQQRIQPRRPSYRGFVSDGWGVDENGKWYFEPDRAAELRTLHLDCFDQQLDDFLDEQLDAGNVPFLDGTAIPRAIEQARTALLRLPRVILKTVYKHGGRVTIEPVAFLPTSSVFGAGDRASGLTCDMSARIAGEALTDICPVVLHEAGHIYDRCFTPRLSSRPAWQALWQAEKDACRLPLGPPRLFPSEAFAELFAMHFGDTRSALSGDVQRYFDTLTV